MEKKIRKLKEQVNTKMKKKIYYLLDDNLKIRTFKPWLSDMFSFLYDSIMSKSIFPKKFNGSIQKHFEILKNEFQNTHNKKIVEIATGSGNAVKFLNNDNLYAGTDISSGLLRIAVKKFNQNRFQNVEFYVADANDLPFNDNFFDVGLCNLSINFFNDINKFIMELGRVLKPLGMFFCSIPVPEMKKSNVKIRGTLYSEEELKHLFGKHNFIFEKMPYENGALLYFKAQLKETKLKVFRNIYSSWSI